MADMMAVMNAGKIVEFGPSESDLRATRKQEYTRDLIDATPKDDLEHIRRRQNDREAALAKRNKWGRFPSLPCLAGTKPGPGVCHSLNRNEHPLPAFTSFVLLDRKSRNLQNAAIVFFLASAAVTQQT